MGVKNLFSENFVPVQYLCNLSQKQTPRKFFRQRKKFGRWKVKSNRELILNAVVLYCTSATKQRPKDFHRC